MYTDILQSFQKNKTSHPHESIRAFIEIILNARAGCISYPSSLGLPDFMYSISSHYFEKLRNMITHAIKSNEPRVEEVILSPVVEKSLSTLKYDLCIVLKNHETITMEISSTIPGRFNVTC